MNFELIYPAIIVFSLMSIGVVLTYLEFKRLEEEQSDSEDISETDHGKQSIPASKSEQS